jgi:hypothetical protein
MFPHSGCINRIQLSTAAKFFAHVREHVLNSIDS